MILLVTHPHFRPGGVRRVIELGAAAIVQQSRERVDRVVLAGGEGPDEGWLKSFRAIIAPVPVTCHVARPFAYVAEQKGSAEKLAERVRRAIDDLVRGLRGQKGVVWVHNPALGRNALVARAWAQRARRAGWRVVFHHHDWWFDNRWARWKDLQRSGVERPSVAARWMLARTRDLRHAAINGRDARALRRGFGAGAGYLPNPVRAGKPPGQEAVEAARHWLARSSGVSGPYWLLPCRLLRRKNVAEALLVTRWLHPEAWLVTTGGASSADEHPYACALAQAAHDGGWPLRLGVLAGGVTDAPGVAELMGGADAIVLSSLVEGFGLPYLEAVAARRPLVARRLANVVPDLRRLGFRLDHLYDEIWVAPDLFHWKTERRRQERRFRTWVASLPAPWRRWVETPRLLDSAAGAAPVPMSQLTLQAQIEVLNHPAAESWAASCDWNPSLDAWRSGSLGAAPRLRTETWPRRAVEALGNRAYGQRFWRLVDRKVVLRPTASRPEAVQETLARERLQFEHLYPLLWRSSP